MSDLVLRVLVQWEIEVALEAMLFRGDAFHAFH